MKKKRPVTRPYDRGPLERDVLGHRVRYLRPDGLLQNRWPDRMERIQKTAAPANEGGSGRRVPVYPPEDLEACYGDLYDLIVEVDTKPPSWECVEEFRRQLGPDEAIYQWLDLVQAARVSEAERGKSETGPE